MSAIIIDDEDEIVPLFLKNENENENENENDNNDDDYDYDYDYDSSKDHRDDIRQKSKSKSQSQQSSSSSSPQLLLLSDLEVGISLAKAIMGAGSFSLPWAFKNMGYIGGPIALFVLMFMSIWSMKLLIDCSNNINNTNSNSNSNNQSSSSSSSLTSSSSYVELARSLYGRIGAKLTYVASISASIGVCGSYLVFIAANLQSLTDQWFIGYYNLNYYDNDNESSTTTTTSTSKSSLLSQTTWIIIITPIAIGLSSIKNMKRFAFASLLGDIAVVLGMVVVIVYAIGYSSSSTTTTTSTTTRNTTTTTTTTSDYYEGCVAFGTSYSTMALSFGSIGYLFLIHFLVLPIQSNMLNKQNFNYVVRWTFVICAVISCTFGVIGYLYFGSKTNQIVLLNIKNDNDNFNNNDNENQSHPSMIFVQIVQLLLCIDLLFTYPVVMRPSIVILLQQQKQKQLSSTRQQKQKQQQYTYYGICIILGLIAAGCSTLVPAFGVLSGFVGGVSQTFLAFVLPPLMYMKTTTTTLKTKKNFISDNNNNNNNNDNKKQQQKQRGGGIINKFLLLLFHDNNNNNNKSPLGLVVMGIILILWTLGSTWNEIMSSSTTSSSSSL